MSKIEIDIESECVMIFCWKFDRKWNNNDVCVDFVRTHYFSHGDNFIAMLSCMQRITINQMTLVWLSISFPTAFYQWNRMMPDLVEQFSFHSIYHSKCTEFIQRNGLLGVIGECICCDKLCAPHLTHTPIYRLFSEIFFLSHSHTIWDQLLAINTFSACLFITFN